MSNWTEEQQEQYEQGNDGGYTPPKGSLDWAEQPAQPEPAPKGTEAWTEQNSGGNAPEPSESKEPPKTDVAPPADKPAGVSPHNDTMGYDQQIAALQEAANRVKPETEEERKKRERREKSAKIVSAVSDGLQALSNLFSTTRGAPNMYDHKEQSQLTPLQEKLEKLRAERQANADKYLQYSLKIGDLQNNRAKTLREMEAEQEKQKLAREKAQREQEEHGWLAALQPDKLREQKGKADKAGYDADTAKTEAENAPELYELKKEEIKSRTNKNNRQGTISWVSGKGGTGGGKGGKGATKRYPVFNADGKVVGRVYTRDEAVSETARLGGKYPETVSTTVSENEYGEKVNTETVQKPTAPGRKPAQPSYENTKKLGY